jgi:hypothetical protein
MGKSFGRGFATFALLLAGLSPAMAQETGLAEALHVLRNESGKLCMSEHFHYGSSNGLSTRKAAEAEAISSWASFTAFEYGSAWSDFRLAGSRGMNCKQASGSWSCEVEARPCKRSAVARKR